MSLEVQFSELVGKTISALTIAPDSERITIKCSDGTSYLQVHHQDCCESVMVEDICGDIADVVGSPVLVAEESSSDKRPEDVQQEYEDESCTWTFYKIDTAKGGITIRWHGSSNGYYSESVNFERTA